MHFSALLDEWSNHKESARKKEGALDRARTDDLRLIRATRYQLRYESCAQMTQVPNNGYLYQVSLARAKLCNYLQANYRSSLEIATEERSFVLGRLQYTDVFAKVKPELTRTVY